MAEKRGDKQHAGRPLSVGSSPSGERHAETSTSCATPANTNAVFAATRACMRTLPIKAASAGLTRRPERAREGRRGATSAFAAVIAHALAGRCDARSKAACGMQRVDAVARVDLRPDMGGLDAAGWICAEPAKEVLRQRTRTHTRRRHFQRSRRSARLETVRAHRRKDARTGKGAPGTESAPFTPRRGHRYPTAADSFSGCRSGSVVQRISFRTDVA